MTSTDIELIYCGNCTDAFADLLSVRHHWIEHHLKKRIAQIHFCRTCQKKFNTIRSFRLHAKTCEDQEVESDDEADPYRCPECAEVFLFQTDLFIHRAEIHKPDGMTCHRQCLESSRKISNQNRVLLKKTEEILIRKAKSTNPVQEISQSPQGRLIRPEEKLPDPAPTPTITAVIGSHYAAETDQRDIFQADEMVLNVQPAAVTKASDDEVVLLKENPNDATLEVPEEIEKAIVENRRRKMVKSRSILRQGETLIANGRHRAFFVDPEISLLALLERGGTKGYFCSLCPRVFCSDYDRKCHRDEVHEGTANKFECDICSDGHLRTALAMHKRKIHGIVTSVVNCKYCGRRFNNLVTLKKHKSMDHQQMIAKQEQHRCKICARLFANVQMLDVHEQEQHQKGLHTCPHCPKSYSRQNELAFHVDFAHKKVVGKLYACSRCSEKCQHLDNHLRRAHKIYPIFTCLQCKDRKRFFRLNTFHQHMNQCHKGPHKVKLPAMAEDRSTASTSSVSSVLRQRPRQEDNTFNEEDFNECQICKAIVRDADLRNHLQQEHAGSSQDV